MKKSFVILFALYSIFCFGLLTSAFAQNPETVTDTNQAKATTIMLTITAPTHVLFNHQQPPQISLAHPNTGEWLLAKNITGKPAAYEPKTYWQTLEPIIWQLDNIVTEDLQDLELHAEIALCDTTDNYCYYEVVDTRGTLEPTVFPAQHKLTLVIPQKTAKDTREALETANKNNGSNNENIALELELGTVSFDCYVEEQTC